MTHNSTNISIDSRMEDQVAMELEKLVNIQRFAMTVIFRETVYMNWPYLKKSKGSFCRYRSNSLRIAK